jgi:hypothetical protein
MGSDAVVYREQAAWFKDWDLWALRSVLLAAADELAKATARDMGLAAARKFVAGWFWLCPGVVSGTNLDDCSDGGQAIAEPLVRIIDRAIGRVREFGRKIPVSYFDEIVWDPHSPSEPAEVYGRPQSVHRFVRLLLRLRTLVTTTPAGSN